MEQQMASKTQMDGRFAKLRDQRDAALDEAVFLAGEVNTLRDEVETLKAALQSKDGQ